MKENVREDREKTRETRGVSKGKLDCSRSNEREGLPRVDPRVADVTAVSKSLHNSTGPPFPREPIRTGVRRNHKKSG